MEALIFFVMHVVRKFFWLSAILVALLLFASLCARDALIAWGCVLYFAVGITALHLYFDSLRHRVTRRRNQALAARVIAPDFFVEGTIHSIAYYGFDTRKRIAVLIDAINPTRVIPFDDFLSVDVREEKGGKRLFKFELRNGTAAIYVGSSTAWEFRRRLVDALGFQ
jgi:hypothetical protein